MISARAKSARPAHLPQRQPSTERRSGQDRKNEDEEEKSVTMNRGDGRENAKPENPPVARRLRRRRTAGGAATHRCGGIAMQPDGSMNTVRSEASVRFLDGEVGSLPSPAGQLGAGRNRTGQLVGCTTHRYRPGRFDNLFSLC
jgi:hypothetical protein